MRPPPTTNAVTPQRLTLRRFVAGALDGLLHLGEAGLRRVVGDPGVRAGERHVHLLHARHAREHARHALHAALAIHSFDLQFDGFHRFSHREFVTTDTELSAIAAPAIIGLSSPAAASGMPSTL